MSKTRIFINNNLTSKIEIILTKSQSHYLSNVLRKKKGDEIYIFNQTQGEWLCEIKSMKGNAIKLFLKKKINKLKIADPIDLWLCFGIIKPKSLSNLVQKTTEIGLKKLIPIKTDFSEKMKLNYQRLNKISIEAVEQSNAFKIPKIVEKIALKDLLKKWDKERTIFVCDEIKPKYNTLKAILENFTSKMAVFIGPVAGWSENDRKILMKHKPIFISLGDSLLKADTAAIFALSCFKIVRDFKNE